MTEQEEKVLNQIEVELQELEIKRLNLLMRGNPLWTKRAEEMLAEIKKNHGTEDNN